MIRLAIAEDNLAEADLLRQYIEQYSKESGKAIQVTVYRDGDELVEAFRSQFDVILMDVEMPYLNGMDAAAMIRRVDQEVIIIFITNMSQYAVKGYEVDAHDYLLKPVSYFVFSQRLNRALSRLKKNDRHFIMVSIKGGTIKVDVSELKYAESQGHKLIYHTASSEYHSSGSIAELEEKLSGYGFVRINKGTLVNLDAVDGIQDGCAVIENARLLISRSRKNDFMSQLTDHLGGSLL